METHEELMKSWVRLCMDPRTAGDLLEKAAYWESINLPKSYMLRLAVAKHRSATPEVLSTLAMVKYLPLQIAVAGHSNLSESTAAQLLKTQVRELRRSLASNPSIPEFVMEKLSKDFIDVRVRLARNPCLSFQIQRRFALEKDVEVRRALCFNRKLHSSVIERLGHDGEAEVRAAIVEHPDMPRSGMRGMASDESAQVRAAILARAKEDFAEDLNIFKALAKFKDQIAEEAQHQITVLEQGPEPEPEATD